ncbi:hypothetical protein R3P38DRAFT_3209663 [Favolaschia claudopus]|uniref:Uncharacterized protein n=1 Tax=Favolaschia claudopus TaxID=2862362 RepID=A0AAW0AHB8_9AGAR
MPANDVRAPHPQHVYAADVLLVSCLPPPPTTHHHYDAYEDEAISGQQEHNTSEPGDEMDIPIAGQRRNRVHQLGFAS